MSFNIHYHVTAIVEKLSLYSKYRGAVNNGASETVVSETLLQASVYARMPVGRAGFRVAAKVLEDPAK